MPGVLKYWNGSSWVEVDVPGPVGPTGPTGPTGATGPSDTNAGRNLIINGAMQVAQRGTSATGITASGYYTADRWNVDISSLGTWTQTVETDGPTGSGFAKSLKMLCTTADSSPAAGDLALMQCRFEGQDLQRVLKGTSSAQQLTLSFWVKSNVTGTYIISAWDTDNSRRVSATYSIVSSATWEKKTITFPADTTGAFNNDNDLSLSIQFMLGLGSTYTSGTLQTTWGSITNANIGPGQTNLAAATNNYWQVTGVQLEVGPVATGFDFEPYETTLRKCQRYYWKFNTINSLDYFCIGQAYSTTAIEAPVNFPVTMRSNPTAIETTGTAGDYRLLSSSGTLITPSSVPSFVRASRQLAVIGVSVSTGLTGGNAVGVLANTNVAYIGFSSEL